MSTNDRTKNPHREVERAPLLVVHPIQPASLAVGIALTCLGALFLAQQLGAITLGPAATGVAIIAAAAGILVGVALGWSRRPQRPDDSEADA